MVQPPPPSSLPPPRPRSSSSTSGASLKGRADDACVEAMLDFLDFFEFFSKTESDTSESGTVLPPAFPCGEREEDDAASFEGWVEDKTEELFILLLVAFVAFVVFVAFVAFEFDDFDEK